MKIYGQMFLSFQNPVSETGLHPPEQQVKFPSAARKEVLVSSPNGEVGKQVFPPQRKMFWFRVSLVGVRWRSECDLICFTSTHQHAASNNSIHFDEKQMDVNITAHYIISFNIKTPLSLLSTCDLKIKSCTCFIFVHKITEKKQQAKQRTFLYQQLEIPTVGWRGPWRH